MTTNTKSIFLAASLGVLHLTSVQAEAQSVPTSVAKLLADSPYRFAGRLLFNQDSLTYVGSAVVIKPSSLLTAGHNLYAEGSGWSTDVVFERSYDYNSSSSRSTASSVFLLGGYAAAVDSGKYEANAGFSRDMGGIVCFSQPANGLYATWKLGKPLLMSSLPKMSLGYGAEVHSGEELLRSSSSRPFRKITGSFYETKYYGIEGGMSGGPVLTKSKGKWYVCAVNVSGPGVKILNRDAGVRIIDNDAAALIRTSLK
jgi:hypothetical protein